MPCGSYEQEYEDFVDVLGHTHDKAACVVLQIGLDSDGKEDR